MTEINDWAVGRSDLIGAIAQAPLLADLGRPLLVELDAAGKAYEAQVAIKLVTTTTLVDGPAIPANVAFVDRVTRAIQNTIHPVNPIPAYMIPPYAPGDTTPAVNVTPTTIPDGLPSRIAILKQRAEVQSANPLYLEALKRCEALPLREKVAVTNTKRVVSGVASPAAIAALTAVLAQVNTFVILAAGS